MKPGVRRKRPGGSARRQALPAAATSLADVHQAAGGHLRREDGQALVEFAVVLPLLLLLVTGIIQFGLLFHQYITLTDAVESGAQTLALGRGLTNACDPAVSQTLQSGSTIGLTSAQVTPSFPSSSDQCGSSLPYTYSTTPGTGNTVTGGNSWTLGDQATVTATQTFTLGVFGLGLFQLPLTASASDAIQ